MNTLYTFVFKAAYIFNQIILALAFAGIIFFSIGLISFGGAPVRSVLMTSSVDLKSLYETLALGLAACSCVCGLAMYAGQRIR